jgi:hypothetical protein
MLLKLLKNDFIQTGRSFLWLLASGVAGGGLGVILTMQQDIRLGQAMLALVWNFLLFTGSLLLFALGLVIILVSTNRALFSERGYLTFALPVSSTQMLLSKFVSNVLLMVAVTAEVGALWGVAASNIFRLGSNVSAAVSAQLGMEDMGAQLAVFGFGNMFPTLGDVLKYLGYLLAQVLVFMLLAMMIALFVLTVSHVRPFQARPGLFVPVFLVATSAVFWQVDRWITEYAKLNVNLNFGGLLAEQSISINLVHAFVMLGMSAALFGVTDYLMSRKISLK